MFDQVSIGNFGLIFFRMEIAHMRALSAGSVTTSVPGKNHRLVRWHLTGASPLPINRAPNHFRGVAHGRRSGFGREHRLTISHRSFASVGVLRS